MSYDIVKSIAVSGDKVYVTSAANNIYPRTFDRYEAESLSKVYQEEGMPGLLKTIGKNVWNGNIKLQPSGSKICKLMAQSLTCIEGPGGRFSPSVLRNFLDEERGGAFLADTTEKLMFDPGFYPQEELAKLENLRHNKKDVLSVCQEKADAFFYADPAVQQDREAAQAYIETCAGELLFRFPQHFADDKDLALLALPKNGCIYRQLSEDLRGDPDIIRLAFDASLERQFFEHLPDLIPKQQREDASFMRELIALCPALHVDRAPDILADRDSAMLWAQMSKYFPNSIRSIPNEFLKDLEFQKILVDRCEGDPEKFKKLQDIYAQCGLYLYHKNVTSVDNTDLASKIRTAQEKAAVQTPGVQPVQEQGR